MFSFKGQKKWFLWLAALAVLVALIKFYPELRKGLWFEPRGAADDAG